MGYMRHHALLVTSWDPARINRAHEQAHRTAAKCGPQWYRLITPIMDSIINAEYTFVIVPDGSKEGWHDSDAGDRFRQEMLDWLESERYDDGSSAFRWALVQYGDDNGNNGLLRTDESPTARYENDKTDRRPEPRPLYLQFYSGDPQTGGEPLGPRVALRSVPTDEQWTHAITP